MTDVGVLAAVSVQAAFTAVITGVTYWYARSTREIARADQEVVKHTEEQIEIARASSAPRLIPSGSYHLYTWQSEGVAQVTFGIKNVGLGPALNVFIQLEHPHLRFDCRKLLVIPAGAEQSFFLRAAATGAQTEDDPRLLGPGRMTLHYSDVMEVLRFTAECPVAFEKPTDSPWRGEAFQMRVLDIHVSYQRIAA